MARRKVKSARRTSNYYRAVATHAALKLADADVLSRDELVSTIKSVTSLKKSSHRSIGDVITTMAQNGLLRVTARGNFKTLPASYPTNLAAGIVAL